MILNDIQVVVSECFMLITSAWTAGSQAMPVSVSKTITNCTFVPII